MTSAPTRRTRLAVLISAAACGLVMFLSACAVGPKYQSPAVDVPPTYRGLTPEQATRSDSHSIGDEKWWGLFQDKVLQDLIRTALANNYDLRIAASRVLQAQARLGVTRADQFPSHQRRRRHYQPGQPHDWSSPLISGYAGPGKRFRLMDSRLLGEISSSDRSSQGPTTLKRLGAAGGGFHVGSQCCELVFPDLRPRSSVGSIATHPRVAKRIVATDPHAGRTRL